MQIDPDSEAGRQWIADNTFDDESADDVLDDAAFRCTVCRQYFSDRYDLDDNDECDECAADAWSYEEGSTLHVRNGSVVG